MPCDDGIEKPIRNLSTFNPLDSAEDIKLELEMTYEY